jgi:hypothetical protein
MTVKRLSPSGIENQTHNSVYFWTSSLRRTRINEDSGTKRTWEMRRPLLASGIVPRYVYTIVESVCLVFSARKERGVMNVVIKEKESELNEAEQGIVKTIFEWFNTFGAGTTTFDVDNTISDRACDEILCCVLESDR